MKAAAVAALAVCTLFAGSAGAQDKIHPVALVSFVELFTNPAVTSARKAQGLKTGTWYEGTITVTDVEYYKKQGAEAAFAEIRDENYRGGCFLLIFRTPDTGKALALSVDDKVVVRGRLAGSGLQLSKFVSGCQTRYALFKDCEILGAPKPQR
jgi:hypothetical protein